MFSLCPPLQEGGGTPSADQVQVEGGVPLPRSRWGGGGVHPFQVLAEGYHPLPRSRQGGLGVPPSQVQAGGWGDTLPRSRWGEYPTSTWEGVSPTPPPPTWTWEGGTPLLSGDSSIVSTCCAAGGMPLAFTQEDFLV